MKEAFFEESTEQSRVKAVIVSQYFWIWAKIIMPHAKKAGDRIAYIDLFAGPGRYQDGTKSTPILILENAIRHPQMSRMLVTIFNDKDENSTKSLETAIKSIPGIETLSHKPVVQNEEVGIEMVKMFEEMRLVPALFFVDPWGYKGLSLKLVNAVVKDWACECVFFFNYNRVNMGLTNPFVEDPMNALFGKERADTLRNLLPSLAPVDRELTIVEELCAALNPTGTRFVLPFRFRNDDGTRTSHQLFFVTKHFLGYNIMKNVMASQSSRSQQGVASFEYSPADARFPLLFELARPIDQLERMLTNDFAGKTISFAALYENHSVGKPFVETNYKHALTNLENASLITADKPGKKRRKGTFADDVLITFPKKGMK